MGKRRSRALLWRFAVVYAARGTVLSAQDLPGEEARVGVVQGALDATKVLTLWVAEELSDEGQPFEELVVPMVQHRTSQIKMPPFVAATDKMREKCSKMKKNLPTKRRSILPEREIRRVEAKRGSIFMPLSAFVVNNGHVTLDGLVFDSERIYLWEKEIDGRNFSDILLRHGLSNYLYAFTELGLFQKVPGGSKVRMRPQEATGAALLRVFSSPWAQQKLKSGFLLSSLTSMSTYFKGSSPAACQKEHARTIVSHGCLVVVYQMFAVNYAHWIESVLPKIVRTLTEQTLRHTIDEWQCSYLLYRTAFEDAYLSLLGIPEERIIRYSPCLVYHARRVIVMNPLPRDHMLAEHVQIVRSHLARVFPTAAVEGDTKPKSLVFDSRLASSDSSSAGDRAFTTRLAGSFTPSNIKEVRAELQDLAASSGLVYEEYIDFHRWTLRDSIALFRRTAEFVFLHGAGGMNMVHIQPCARAIEVQPEHHPYHGMGCGASNALFLSHMVQVPLVALVVEGTTMQPVLISVKHLRRAHIKVRSLSLHGCPPLEPPRIGGAGGEL